MQRRMEMGLRKYRPQGMEIINYAAYQAEVVAQGSQLTYREAIPGMWNGGSVCEPVDGGNPPFDG